MQNLFFWIIFSYIWIGYVLNCVLPVSFYDEIIALSFLVLLLCKKLPKEVLMFLGIDLFYIVYSLFFSVNHEIKAILLDALQQSKPYIFFYTFYIYRVSLSEIKKLWLRYSVIIGVLLSLGSYFYDNSLYSGLYTHPALFGISMFCLSLIFFYSGNGEIKDRIVVTIILSIGLLSMRSKFYGEYIVALSCLYLLHKRIRFSFKYIFFGCMILYAILYFASFKINYYFSNEESARLVLYQNVPKILIDYFPFGSGLASYGSFFSGEYYSPLYYRLGIDNIWGLSPRMNNFISDTFFPSLAQEGVLGVVLFLLFWIRRFNSVNKSSNMDHQKLGIMIISFFFIESVAGSAYVMVYSFIPLYILATICGKSDDRFLHTRRMNFNFRRMNFNHQNLYIDKTSVE